MKVWVSSLVLCTLLCGAASNIAAQTHAVVLIDRSFSMIGRCDGVVAPATADVNAFFTANPSGRMVVIPFNGIYSCYIPFPGTSGRLGGQADALAELALLSSGPPVPSCGGETPLAECMCYTADFWRSITPGPTYLYLHTDGGENSSAGIFCAGPSDADGVPPWDVGSYQALILDALIAGNIVTYVTYYGPGIVVPSSKTVSLENGLASDVNPDYEFLVDVAAQTGGSFTYITDEGPVEAQTSTWGTLKSSYERQE